MVSCVCNVGVVRVANGRIWLAVSLLSLFYSFQEDLIKDEKKPAVEDSAAEPPIKKICFNER